MVTSYSDCKTTILDLTVGNYRWYIWKYPIVSNGTIIKYKYNYEQSKIRKTR